MKVVTDDGEEVDDDPGDFAIMAPGHDAWIVGDRPGLVAAWHGIRRPCPVVAIRAPVIAFGGLCVRIPTPPPRTGA